MSTRIIQGNSPFKPDKTHLHHLFIKLGYSHIGTTLSIIFMNLLVVLCWYCAYKFGLSINMQLYIVIALGVLFTFILYPIVDSQTGKNTAISRFLRRIGSLSHKSRSKFWISMQKIVDISVVKQIQEPQD